VRSRSFLWVLVAVAAVAAAAVIGFDVGRHDDNTSRSTPAAAASTSSRGVTRTPLGQATPANAPGQVLYLQQVTIAPKAKLARHFHQGTQVARVISGVLTYNIVSGSGAVTHAGGRTEEVSGPGKIELRPGDSIIETTNLVHFGANDTSHPVVIELAALLQQGAPLATSVP
jgi:quercetin dioxygenase-like cupin family protein